MMWYIILSLCLAVSFADPSTLTKDRDDDNNDDNNDNNYYYNNEKHPLGQPSNINNIDNSTDISWQIKNNRIHNSIQRNKHFSRERNNKLWFRNNRYKIDSSNRKDDNQLTDNDKSTQLRRWPQHSRIWSYNINRNNNNQWNAPQDRSWSSDNTRQYKISTKHENKNDDRRGQLRVITNSDKNHDDKHNRYFYKHNDRHEDGSYYRADTRDGYGSKNINKSQVKNNDKSYTRNNTNNDNINITIESDIIHDDDYDKNDRSDYKNNHTKDNKHVDRNDADDKEDASFNDERDPNNNQNYDDNNGDDINSNNDSSNIENYKSDSHHDDYNNRNDFDGSDKAIDGMYIIYRWARPDDDRWKELINEIWPGSDVNRNKNSQNTNITSQANLANYNSQDVSEESSSEYESGEGTSSEENNTRQKNLMRSKKEQRSFKNCMREASAVCSRACVRAFQFVCKRRRCSSQEMAFSERQCIRSCRTEYGPYNKYSPYLPSLPFSSSESSTSLPETSSTSRFRWASE